MKKVPKSQRFNAWMLEAQRQKGPRVGIWLTKNQLHNRVELLACQLRPHPPFVVRARSKQSRVEREILSYLVKHPRARDTLEGIVGWWLVEERIIEQTGVVRAALSRLVRDGLVLEDKGIDSRIHYRINEQRLREIEVLVEQKSDAPPCDPN